MVIWSGWGFLVAVIVLGCGVVVEYAIEADYQDPDFYQANGWPKLVAMLMAASVVHAANRFVYRRDDGLARLAGGESPEPRYHSLFWISMRIWPAVLVVVGIVLLFVRV